MATRVIDLKLLYGETAKLSLLPDYVEKALALVGDTWPRPPIPQWGIPPTREGPLSNARPELLLKAGARHERTLEAVSSRLLLGCCGASHGTCGTTPRTANAFARSENPPSGLSAWSRS